MKRAVLFCLALMISSAALAQSKVESVTGSHIPIPERARIPDENQAVRKLSTDDCLDAGSITFNSHIIRRPLFAELLRRRTLAQQGSRVWGPVIPPIDLGAPLAGRPDEELQYIGLMAFGSCMVSQDRPAAMAVVLAATASLKQDAAIAVIAPKISDCVTQGQTMKLPKQVLEGLLAEVLYRGVTQTKPIDAQPSNGAPK